MADGMRRRAIIGDPATVAARLLALTRDTAADELILTVNVPDPALRRQALALIMDAVRAAEGNAATTRPAGTLVATGSR